MDQVVLGVVIFQSLRQLGSHDCFLFDWLLFLFVVVVFSSRQLFFFCGYSLLLINSMKYLLDITVVSVYK